MTFREYLIDDTTNKDGLTEGENVKNLISIMNGWLNQGWSLSDIYDEVVDFQGLKTGGLMFYEFVKTHKKDKKFMAEFNRTAFKK